MLRCDNAQYDMDNILLRFDYAQYSGNVLNLYQTTLPDTVVYGLALYNDLLW